MHGIFNKKKITSLLPYHNLCINVISGNKRKMRMVPQHWHWHFVFTKRAFIFISPVKICHRIYDENRIPLLESMDENSGLIQLISRLNLIRSKIG